MHRNTQPNSPFKNVFFRSSRGNEAQISLERNTQLEPPHVGCYFFDELVGARLISPRIRASSAALKRHCVFARLRYSLR